jgi:hypothetical protein
MGMLVVQGLFLALHGLRPLTHGLIGRRVKGLSLQGLLHGLRDRLFITFLATLAGDLCRDLCRWQGLVLFLMAFLMAFAGDLE